MIEQAYYRKILSENRIQSSRLYKLNAVKILLDLLQEAGLVAGEFDPDALFEMELGAIQAATQDLYESLKILVGDHVQTPDLNYKTGSSHYALRIGYLRTGFRLTRAPLRINKLDEYFQMAMNRFLKEQNLVTMQPPPLGTQDVDMESVGTPDLASWEYDPDDLGIPSSSGHNPGRAAVTTAAIGSGNSPSLIQRVRISAISDLKEFTGKDMDEDRARAWISKVKSAFQRDQATEEEKCVTFGDLMVGSAKNWHRQLSRTTKTKWADLLESFQTQYC
ncbi:hypothetical protein PHMEG_00036840, partial [Phytophthora megakarya]